MSLAVHCSEQCHGPGRYQASRSSVKQDSRREFGTAAGARAARTREAPPRMCSATASSSASTSRFSNASMMRPVLLVDVAEVGHTLAVPRSGDQRIVVEASERVHQIAVPTRLDENLVELLVHSHEGGEAPRVRLVSGRRDAGLDRPRGARSTPRAPGRTRGGRPTARSPPGPRTTRRSHPAWDLRGR